MDCCTQFTGAASPLFRWNECARQRKDPRHAAPRCWPVARHPSGATTSDGVAGSFHRRVLQFFRTASLVGASTCNLLSTSQRTLMSSFPEKCMVALMAHIFRHACPHRERRATKPSCDVLRQVFRGFVTLGSQSSRQVARPRSGAALTACHVDRLLSGA